MAENDELCTKVYPNYGAGSCGCGKSCGCGCDCGSNVGPAGATATNDNALLYAEASQTVANGATLALGTNVINSTDGSIAASGTTGVTLAPGQYLVTFVTDATTTAEGPVGAALALNGTPVTYTESNVTTAAAGERRIALNSVLTVSDQSTLTVQNNTGTENAYENSSLTVVRLA